MNNYIYILSLLYFFEIFNIENFKNILSKNIFSIKISIKLLIPVC